VSFLLLASNAGLLEGSLELELLLGGLEATVSELGGGVDELELDLLGGVAVGLGADGLAEGDDTLLGSDDGSLEHDEVLEDGTVVGESSHGGDGLLGQIELSHGVEASILDLLLERVVVLLGSLGLLGSITSSSKSSLGLVVADSASDAVDLLVELSTVVVTQLTSAGNSPGNTGRMPSSDTSNLAETLVRLAGKLGDSETGNDSLESVTLGDSHGVNHLVLVEDGINSDLLLEELTGVVDLLGDGTSVDLDFHDVGLLLSNRELVDLGVGDHTHNLAVALDAVQLAIHLAGTALGSQILGEGLLLRDVPVLVETAAEVVGQMAGPDGGEGAETTGGADVSDDTNDNHGGGFEDGNSLDDLLLVDLGAGLVDLTHDVGHTSLVRHEGGEMARLSLVIRREGLYLSLMVCGTLAGDKSQTSVARTLKLTMRH